MVIFHLYHLLFIKKNVFNNKIKSSEIRKTSAKIRKTSAKIRKTKKRRKVDGVIFLQKNVKENPDKQVYYPIT
jgi:hypothetical protein